MSIYLIDLSPLIRMHIKNTCYKLANISLLVKSEYPKNKFSYFSIKTYVMGTQKNSLKETVLMSTQNKCPLMDMKIFTILH